MRPPSIRLARVELSIAIVLSALVAGCGDDATPVTPDAAVMLCTMQAQCDDGLFCNGAEQCMPSSAAANANGCVAATPPCIANVMCDEATDACGTVCTNSDMDGDGRDAVACGGDDCDDNDADRFPGNPETCDDGDGGQHDEDCDPTTFGSTDRDGDGEVAASCCNMGASALNCGSDCDDTTIRRRSGQVEFCDSTDNDCDGRTDEETQDVPWYPDTDGDGFGGTTTPTVSCTPVEGHSLAATDCDDESAQQHPGQLDICDLSDNNCNDDVDELPLCGEVQLVGAAGATLTIISTGGGTVRVVIPAAALSASTPIALGEIHPRTLPDLGAGQSFVGRPVALSPYGLSFGAPASVTLPAAGPNLAVLRLTNQDDNTWELVEATFTGGQALFQADSSGIYVVATKVCSATTETCDSLDNDCDWLVDEENVCATSAVTTRDAFVAALSELAEAEYAACYSTAPLPANFPEAGFREWIAATLNRDRLAAGYIALDLERANHILNVMRAWPDCASDVEGFVEAAFYSAVRGYEASPPSSVGEPCESSRNCELGLHCVNPPDSTPCRGTCENVPGQALGQRCRSHADCALTNSSSDRLVVCAPNGVGVDVCQEQPAPSPLPIGQEQVDFEYDDADLENEFVRANCGVAATDVDIDDSFVFVDGRVGDRFTCEPLIAIGADCDPSDEYASDCGDYADCNPTTSSRTRYRCYAATVVTAGAACSGYGVEEVGRGERVCAAGYECDEESERCVLEECTSDDDCESGFGCANGLDTDLSGCFLLRAIGEPCDDRGECLTDACDYDGGRTCIARQAMFSPGGAEVCDGEDNDCDGRVDDGLPNITLYFDNDGDGYYGAGATPVLACGLTRYTSDQPGDCEPYYSRVNPGEEEQPNNRLDDDCNPQTSDDSCGNGTCEAGEEFLCLADCCGDGVCCGDDFCDTPENPISCPADCS